LPSLLDYRDPWNLSVHKLLNTALSMSEASYDASLTGLGVGIYKLSTSTLLTYASLELPFIVTNESKQQNTMKFIAVILGLLLAWRTSLHNFTYTLHGDSASS
jgi:hypothetical protein